MRVRHQLKHVLTCIVCVAAAVIVSLSAAPFAQTPPSGSASRHATSLEFNQALGVACTHCHVPDRWSDSSRPTFETARQMLRMVDVLNTRLDNPGRVACITCHGGQTRPARQPRAPLDEQLARWPAALADAPESLKVTMAVYNVALGVTCDHCHSADWKARDKAPMKKVPVMTSLFEEFPKYMPSTARTQCFMCHKGSTRPSTFSVESTATCQGPEYQLLDFWLGSWEVVRSGSEPTTRVGTNVIEKAAGSCAVLEHWSDPAGGSGKSLFYYHRAAGAWKQVWVASDGSVKEKRAVESPGNGAVRFQGEVRMQNGTTVLDRTTLTPLAGGRVGQHIEVSSDAGATWRVTFDAVYLRRDAPNGRF